MKVEHKGWYRGKYLPHFDAGGLTQDITFRLADSLPRAALDRLEESLTDSGMKRDIERANRIGELLDQGFGSCILREPACAEIVANAINFLDGDRYELKAWVVMPNHVHLLAHFSEGQSLSKAMHSLKSFTTHEIQKLHREMSLVWQIEVFDRYIRNEAHFLRKVDYIHQNPVVAKLCRTPEEYRWSSAYLRNAAM
ncbi:MAG TPA: transposase [Fimbriimonas sp.]|nr:transposase [Fimbriimonas sp.]